MPVGNWDSPVDKSKVSANDSTADFLISKLVAGTAITLTEQNDGGNETLEIAFDSGGAGASPLVDVLAVGNTTGGTNIVISDSDSITTTANTVPSLILDHTIGADEQGVILTTSSINVDASLLQVRSTSSSTDASKLVEIINDNAAATGNIALEVRQDSTGLAGNFIGDVDIAGILDVTFSGTSGAGINLTADSLTGDYGMSVTSASTSTNNFSLGRFAMTNAAATAAAALEVSTAAPSAIALQVDGGQILQNFTHTTGIANYIIANSLTSGTAFRVESDAMTTGNLATFISNSASSTIRDLVTIENNNSGATGTTLLNLEQRADHVALDIESTGTISGNVVNLVADALTTGNLLYLEADSLTTGIGINMSFDGLTTGAGMFLDSNSISTASRNLALISNSNVAATGSKPLLLVQNANQECFEARGTGNTTTDVIDINGSALTSGGLARFYTNSADTTVRRLINIINDNAASTNVIALSIQQDGNSRGILLTAGGITSGRGLDVICDGLTSGNAMSVSSNSANVGSRNLIQFVNDNTLATGTDCLFVKQDSSGDGIRINSNGLAINAAGGFSLEPVDISAATHTIDAFDNSLHVSHTSTAAVTITWPTALITNGRRITIKDSGGNAGTNNITINTGGSETIDGASNLVISVNYGSVTLQADGSNLFII